MNLHDIPERPRARANIYDYYRDRWSQPVTPDDLRWARDTMRGRETPIERLLSEIYEQRRRYDAANVQVTERMGFSVTRQEYRALQESIYRGTRGLSFDPTFNQMDGTMRVAGIPILVR